MAVTITMVDDKAKSTKRLPDKEKDYDTYDVSLEGKERSLDATYNADGKMINTYENFKDAPLLSVVEAIEKNTQIEDNRYQST